MDPLRSGQPINYYNYYICYTTNKLSLHVLQIEININEDYVIIILL